MNQRKGRRMRALHGHVPPPFELVGSKVWETFHKASSPGEESGSKARTTLASDPDSYPHLTNEGEKPGEPPEASVCKDSQPFQMVRHPGGPSWDRAK